MPAYDKSVSSQGTFSNNYSTTRKTTKQVSEKLALAAAEFLKQLAEELKDELSISIKSDSLVFGHAVDHTQIGGLYCVLTQKELPSSTVISGKIKDFYWFVYNDEWNKLIRYSMNQEKTKAILEAILDLDNLKQKK